MTIVAYCDRIMAADTMLSSDNLIWANVKKIVKTPDGFLAGAAGDSDYAIKFLAWAQTDRTKPAPKYVKDGEGMLVSPSGIIYLYQSQIGLEISDKHFAIGQGTPSALAVMMCGFTAKKAVEIAIQIHPNCGGEIITETLD